MGEKVWIESFQVKDGWSSLREIEFFDDRAKAIERAKELATNPEIRNIKVKIKGPDICIFESM